jgi:hypothetical protein
MPGPQVNTASSISTNIDAQGILIGINDAPACPANCSLKII